MASALEQSADTRPHGKQPAEQPGEKLLAEPVPVGGQRVTKKTRTMAQVFEGHRAAPN